MAVIGFEEQAVFRIREEEKKKILKVCRKNRDIYENPSHFFRVAVIRLLRQYDDKGREI